MLAARSNGLNKAGVALLASTMLCTAGAAYAQAADSDIIVTAQKREENLQKVPISIQALGTQKLEELNVSSFNDYTKMMPSVTFQTGSPGSASVYMRGVASGGDGNHSGSLPSVGVYLDEQPVTTIGGNLDVHIYDIARIEALAGPQGTLYGASSEAGTLRIITNKPEIGKFAAGIDVEANAVQKGGIGKKVEGFANLPINDRMALRVVGYYQHDAGYIDNVAGSRTFIGLPAINNAKYVEKNYNDVDVIGGRAALKVDLDDNWTTTATVMGQSQKSHGVFGYDASVGDLAVQHFFPEQKKDGFVQGALTIEGKIGNWDVTYAGAYMKRKINQDSDYTDYAEAYDALYADYGGVAGYQYFTDNAGKTILSTQNIVGTDDFNKMSHELRFNSPTDARLRFVGGAFMQRQFHDIRQDYKVANLATAMSVNGNPGTLWLTQQERTDKDYALFGELSYDITEKLTLTGGLRGFKYDNSLLGFFGFGRNPAGKPYNAVGSSRTGVAGCYTSNGLTVRDAGAGTLLAGVVHDTPCTNLGVYSNGTVVPKRAKDDGLIHRLNLTWKPNDDVLGYATWSRGYRPGGINRRSTIAAYKADYLTNFELGLKTSWFDRKVRLNVALFQQDWKNFQFSYLGQNSFTEIHNGPDARIRGVELDLSVRPVEGLSLSGNAAYTDAKTKKNLCAIDDPTYACTGTDNEIQAPKGTRLPVTPKFKASAIARYEYQMMGGTAHAQLVVAHQGKSSTDLRVEDAAALGDLKGFTTFDMAYGLGWDNYSLELFLDNVTDTRAQLSKYVQCSICYQRSYIVTNTPRTIGVRAGYKF